MTLESRTAQAILADQFRLTAELAVLTGEYHRMLQKLAASGFARQLAEMSGDEEALADADRIEVAAQFAADSCEVRVTDLERRLAALGHELASLKDNP